MKRRDLPKPYDRTPFARATALSAGVTHRRLRALDLLTPHRGVRAHHPPAGLADRCREYAPLLTDGQAFSHETAAELWGLPMPTRRLHEASAPLHVAARDGREPHRPGIVGHRILAAGFTFVDGIRVVDPVTAWMQCAESFPLDELTAMADALLGPWSVHPQARERPRAELAAAVTGWRGHRGVRVLREALDLARPRVRSPQETALRLLVIRAGIREPEINVDVFDDRGRWLGESDLVWRDERVVVEYEGDHHRVDPVQFQKDIRRRERYEDAGWRMIRVTRSDLRSRSAEFVARLKSCLR